MGKGACRASTDLTVSPQSPCKDGSTELSSDLTPTCAPWHAHASCTQTYNDNKASKQMKKPPLRVSAGSHVT